MIRFAMRWLFRALLALVAAALLLLTPVGYNELACRGELSNELFASQIAPAEHRAESATYLTYPEWHIVFAYDDYAKVLETGDPHNFGYFKAISGFWGALCNLTRTADKHGGDSETKNMVYVIGVSFTAELLGKALYEETIGRISTWIRGPQHAANDTASMQMARNYADFLHQVPWYKYDFPADVAKLNAIGPQSFRDRERQFALGLEFRAKTAYAMAIAKAVDATGQAKLTIRSIIQGLSPEELRAISGVVVIRATPEGTEIETPRYAAFTDILRQIADKGGNIPEIAGNNEIMATVTGTTKPDILLGMPILAELPRQGYGDMRWLVSVPLSDLANFIRALEGSNATLEHIFDY